MIRYAFGFVRDFTKDTSGVTAVEYAILGTGIAIALVAAVSGLAGTMSATFSVVGGSL